MSRPPYIRTPLELSRYAIPWVTRAFGSSFSMQSRTFVHVFGVYAYKKKSQYRLRSQPPENMRVRSMPVS